MSHSHPSGVTAVIAGLLLTGLGFPGCSGKVTPEVTAGVDACAYCNMVIDDPEQAAGWIRDRRFVPFDNPGCLLAALEALRAKGEPWPNALFFADSRDGTLVPGEYTTFLLTSHRPTVMNSGALAFGSRAAAEQARKHEDEVVTDWIGYRTARGTPDREVDVTLGPEGVTPGRIEVEKGELVSWTVRSVLEKGERTIAVKGYPELEPVRIAAGSTVSFRLLALRPGSGFPILDPETGEVLGALVVHGAHTADEEAEVP